MNTTKFFCLTLIFFLLILPIEGAEQKGVWENRDPGRPRGSSDPASPPTGAPAGIYDRNLDDYQMPYYTAHPGQKALAYFAALLRRDPKNSEYFGRYAFAQVQTGRYKEALATAKQALQLAPDNQWALYSAALATRFANDLTASSTHYENLLATDFANFKDFYLSREYAMLELADIYRINQQLKKAEFWFKKAISSNQKDFLSLKLMERFFVRTGQYKKALAVYQEILQREPNNLNALMNLGILNTHFGDYQKAIDYLTKATTIDSSIMKIYYFLHRANFKAGHFEKAAELLKHCQTFTLKEQARIDRNADKVSPYPCAEVIFQQVFLAAGDFTTLNRFILADLDDEDLSHGAIQEDMAMDYEGYPEFKQEDSLNFLVKSGHDNHLKHSWMTKFEGKLLTTKSKNATNLAHNCALALRDEEWAKALSMAREGMKKFPEQRIFLAQAGVSSAMLKEHKTSISLLKQSLEVPVPGELHDSGQSWKTNLFADHQSIKDWKKQDEIGYLSQLFTILAIADQLIIKSTKTADGNLHYQKTEATQFMTESELQLLGNTLSQVRSELKKITEESDSLTSGAMAHLLISDVDSTLSRDEKAGQYFGKYLNEDPKMQVILSLYKNFGKYYGY